MDPLKERTARILEILTATYPETKTQLHFRNPFELLVATILSAQCTDRMVNAVTGALFEKLPTPGDFAAAPLDEIETLVRKTGFFRNKAKNIKASAGMIVGKFGGKIPERLEELTQLPGVGRKTANVVLGAAFGIPGIVVDTHVARVSRRLGITRNSDPGKIEQDLMKIVPKESWNEFCHQLIYHGRGICVARKPKCPICPLVDLCDYPDKTR
jgi:endonuclease III